MIIINDNLLPNTNKIYCVQNKVEATWGAANFYIDDLGLEDGKEYTISFDVLNLSEKSRGVVGVFVTNTKGSQDTFKINLKASGRVNTTFKYDENGSKRIGLTPGPTGNAGGCGADFYRIKLEKGKNATAFIINKNDVKLDNQAIFPIGGVSRTLSSIEDIRGLVYVN